MILYNILFKQCLTSQNSFELARAITLATTFVVNEGKHALYAVFYTEKCCQLFEYGNNRQLQEYLQSPCIRIFKRCSVVFKYYQHAAPSRAGVDFISADSGKKPS